MAKVCIELQNGHKINIALEEKNAPITVANFLHLVDIKFYDNLIFHRIIKGFMSQAGQFMLNGTVLEERVTGYSIPGEFVDNGFNNLLAHESGTISMARTGMPNSAAAQFFICDADANYLNGEYAAFGKVIDEESMNNVHELSAVPTHTVCGNIADFPNTDMKNVTIKTIYRIED